MKKIMKTFTFWMLLIAVLEIFMHQIGQDSKNIILIGCNPILHLFASSDSLNQFMESGFQISCNTIVGHISVYWYVGTIITFALYGIILDAGKRLFHRLRK